MANHANIADLFDDIAVKIQDKTGNHDDTIVADNFPAAIENIAIPLILTPRDITVQTSASTTATYASNDNIRIRDNEGNDHTLAEWNRLFADAGFDKDNMSVQPVGIRVQAADVDEVYLFDRYTGVTYNPSGEAAGEEGKLQHSLYNHNLVTGAGSGTDSTTNKGWSVVADGNNLILNEENTGQSWTIASGAGSAAYRHQAFNTRDRVQALWAQTEWLRHRMAIDSGLTTSEPDGTMASVQILNSSGAQAAVGEDMYFWIGGTNTNKLAKYNLNNRHGVSGYYLTQAIADAIYAAQIAQGVNMNDTGVNSASKPVLAPGSKGAEAIAVGGKWYIITPYISNPSATSATVSSNLADSPAIYWAVEKGYALPGDGLLDVMYFNKTLCDAVVSYLNSVENRGLPTIPINNYIWTAIRFSASYAWSVFLSFGLINYTYPTSRYFVCGASSSTPQPAIEEDFISKTAQHSGPAKVLKVYGKSVVNNQLVQNGDFSDGLTGWTIDAGNTASVSGDVVTILYDSIYPDGANARMTQTISLTNGHKMLVIFDMKVTTQAVGKCYPGYFSSPTQWFDIPRDYSYYADWKQVAVIKPLTSDKTTAIFGLYKLSGSAISSGDSVSMRNIRVVDLTQRFGAGNEPTSVDEALRLLGGDAFNPAYDAGSLQSNKTSLLRAERIPVINVWDEEWEVGGYAFSTGAKAVQTDRIRNLNGIGVSPATTYYVKGPARIAVLYYAQDGTYLGYDDNKQNQVFTTPANCVFVNFFCVVTTYNHDICINLSDPAINGQYFPHWRGSLALNITSLTSGGTPCCPDGLAEWAGTADELLPEGILKRRLFKPTLSTNVGDMSNYSWEELRGVAFSSGSTNMPAYETRPPYFSLNFGSSADSSSSIRPNSTSFLWLGVSSRAIIHLMSVAYATSIGVYDSNNDKIDLNAYAAWIATVDRTVYYIMSTEQRILLDAPLPTDFDVRAGDKMIAESDNNCQFVGDIVYKV